eukprot:CAMPEP_0114651330 /NCGR_PEP_ID=MMETSP0191-20121206/8250_1 /TAXON_ID=126664 /ORGANISM="Sorites sp." /LENGTH=180 /DNA_ID=CAMNT_0001865465 /DNA_START=49 /DNA_END=591 /DNA_ORIENTATION=-
MALSMRFLARASQSLESMVSQSPKALRTPTPKTPSLSPFGLSPLASLNHVSFFPENVEMKSAKGCSTMPLDGATWVGNATRLLGGHWQQVEDVEATSSPITALTTAAATRDAVRARLARRDQRREAPGLPVATELPHLPRLGRAQRPAQQLDVSCAHATHKAVLEQKERRASRAMVDFVI